MSVYGERKLLAFDPAQLETGATGAQAALAIGLGSFMPYGFDFDPEGNLWVGAQAGEVLKYAADDLGRSGTPQPVMELGTGLNNSTSGVRFAPDGSLWATAAAGLVSWAPATLTAGGSPPPDVTLTSASPAMTESPNDLEFDPNGGVWLVGNGALVHFTAQQLAAGGEVDPEVVIGSDGSSLASPRGLAFDANGDLWVSNLVSGNVEKFRRQDLQESGTPTPIVSLMPPGTYKMRVGFDEDDNLWVSSVYAPGFGPAGYVAMISPPNRVSSGGTVASVEFSELGSIDSGGVIVFHPGPR